MSIEVLNLSRKFGSFTALQDVNLQVNAGELLALLGPSGSGKTTLLRVIAGLETVDSGQVLFHGEDATDQHVRERQVGFVFQHYALFRNMTIFENVAFGLRVRPKEFRPSNKEIQSRVIKLLQLVQLDWLAHRYPHQLSGGQRQRIALARALAVEPRVLLLDEPFGALDAKVRKELRRWLRKLHDARGLTTIFVTHDQEEAMEVSDRIGILNKGSLVQLGTPIELWEHPINSFVFDFIGNYNTFVGFKTIDDKLVINYKASDVPSGALIKAFSRPHEIILERIPKEIPLSLPATVVLINRAGPFIKIELEGDSGVFYQADVEKATFEAMQIKNGESLFVRPLLYRSFNE